MLLVPESLEQAKREMARALEERRIQEAVEHALELSPGRTARILREAPAASVIPALQAMGAERAGRVLGHFPAELAAQVLGRVPPGEAADLLRHAPEERATAIFHALEERNEKAAAAVLDRLPPESAAVIRRISDYPTGSVGAVMTTRFLAIRAGATVGAIIEAVQSSAAELDRGAYVYVLDEANKPAGVIALRDLLRFPPEEPVEKVMEPNVVAVHVLDPAADAARTLRNRRFMMLPVLDDGDALVGVLTFDRAMEILNQEVATQFLRIGAGSREESFFTPPMVAARGRLPWMAANVFLNLGAVAVITMFEDTIAQIAILAAFLPMITDMGGNVGIQALSVAIRSIALGEVRLRDFWRAARKEVLIGVVNGIALGGLFALLATFMRGNPWLGLVAGLALGVNVFVAGLVGGVLPFIIKRFGKDPAMMTGPILTTITDITGVTIYLGLSTLFLALILA